MKYAAQLLLAPLVAAFPDASFHHLRSDPVLAARAAEILKGTRSTNYGAAQALWEPHDVFDAESQYINVGRGSVNEWKAPERDAFRGPCPGLNILANHGFIPRNGIATAAQIIEATTEVYGLGPVLAAFLATYAVVMCGNGVYLSIGGRPSSGILGPLIQSGNGLDGAHNKMENDASLFRPDLYLTGNNYELVVEQFQQLVDMAASKDDIDLEVLMAFRSKRLDDSVNRNPYFINAPFTGLFGAPGSYFFVIRLLSNYSADHPHGKMSLDLLKNVFGVEGESRSFTAKFGHERLPPTWSRRPRIYPYDMKYALDDIIEAAAMNPKFLELGGNTKGVNTFTGIDLYNLTGGIYQVGDLKDPNKFACLGYQLAAMAKPDALPGVVSALSHLLDPLISALACPKLEKIDNDLLMRYPGYRRSTEAGITK